MSPNGYTNTFCYNACFNAPRLIYLFSLCVSLLQELLANACLRRLKKCNWVKIISRLMCNFFKKSFTGESRTHQTHNMTSVGSLRQYKSHDLSRVRIVYNHKSRPPVSTPLLNVAKVCQIYQI